MRVDNPPVLIVMGTSSIVTLIRERERERERERKRHGRSSTVVSTDREQYAALVQTPSKLIHAGI